MKLDKAVEVLRRGKHRALKDGKIQIPVALQLGIEAIQAVEGLQRRFPSMTYLKLPSQTEE